jgi:DNA polymerase-4
MHEPKQISQETTFPSDIHDPGKMRQVLGELATELSHRLRRRHLKGRVVTLKARYPDFQTVTRSQSLVIYIDQSAPILKLALELLGRTEAFGRGVRLLGIGIAGFDREESKQLDLFRRAEDS